MDDDDPLNDQPLNNDDALRRAFELAEHDDGDYLHRLGVVVTLALTFIGSACWMVALVAAATGTPEWAVVFFLTGAAVFALAGWLHTET